MRDSRAEQVEEASVATSTTTTADCAVTIHHDCEGLVASPTGAAAATPTIYQIFGRSSPNRVHRELIHLLFCPLGWIWYSISYSSRGSGSIRKQHKDQQRTWLWTEPSISHWTSTITHQRTTKNLDKRNIAQLLLIRFRVSRWGRKQWHRRRLGWCSHYSERTRFSIKGLVTDFEALSLDDTYIMCLYSAIHLFFLRNTKLGYARFRDFKV